MTVNGLAEFEEGRFGSCAAFAITSTARPVYSGKLPTCSAQVGRVGPISDINGFRSTASWLNLARSYTMLTIKLLLVHARW